jgi:transcriptional regulator with XRE-family HTH domain
MTVKELSAHSGVKKATIDSYLNYHRRMPSAEAALRIAKALGVTVEQLFGEVEEARPAQPSLHFPPANNVCQLRDLAKQIRTFADMLEGLYP